MNITAKDFELSPSMTALAQEKVKKIERLLTHIEPDLYDITVTYQKAQPESEGFVVDVRVQLPSKTFYAKGKNYQADSAVIDAVEKVSRQIKSHLDKVRGTDQYSKVAKEKRSIN